MRKSFSNFVSGGKKEFNSLIVLEAQVLTMATALPGILAARLTHPVQSRKTDSKALAKTFFDGGSLIPRTALPPVAIVRKDSPDSKSKLSRPSRIILNTCRVEAWSDISLLFQTHTATMVTVVVSVSVAFFRAL